VSFFNQTVSNKTRTELHNDEHELISLLKQGNEKAFRTLIRQYQSRLYSIAYGICLDREECLDIVQDVFLKVYQNIHTFREDSGLYPWLRRITINRSLNWRRSWKRRLGWSHQSYDEFEPGDYRNTESGDNPDDLYEKKEIRRLFQAKLKILSEDARVVFVLKEVEGLSYDEISKALNIKKGTVSSRLFSARQQLRESMKEYLYEEDGP